MISIVAVDKNWGIGKDGKLPWKIPGEQKFFKQTTMGGVVIMGRKTLDSLPGGKPLKGRRNIIITRNNALRVDGAESVTSPEALFNLLGCENPEKVFLIGGAQIYRLLIPYCKKAIVTKVKDEFDVDAHHPNLDRDSNWLLMEESDEITASNGISYSICRYENSALSR
jgi:dihydrofolate reductase